MDDGPAEGPIVEIRRAVAAQQPVGPRKVRIAEQVAHRQRVACWCQEQGAAGRVGPQFGKPGLGELPEVRVDAEPAVRDLDRRPEVCGQALAAVQAQRLSPGGHH